MPRVLERVDAFTLAPEHVALLRAANVQWGDDEFGAPAIDPKRPYGNSSVLRDIHRILTGQDWDEDEQGGMPRDLRERYAQLHRETRMALQIVLATGRFEPGRYVAPKWTNAWERMPGAADEASSLIFRDVEQNLVLRIGPPPGYAFEWGEGVAPDAAARSFAAEVSRLLGGGELEGAIRSALLMIRSVADSLEAGATNPEDAHLLRRELTASLRIEAERLDALLAEAT